MTKAAKHTPGPWHARLESPRRRIYSMPTGRCIAEIIATDDSDANARLIAAAPDLLAACRVVEDYLDSLEVGTDASDPLHEMRRRFHAPLRAALGPAIAKAEGGESEQAVKP